MPEHGPQYYGETVAWERLGGLRILAVSAGGPDIGEHAPGLVEDERYQTRRLLVLHVGEGQLYIPPDYRVRIAEVMCRLGARQAVISDHPVTRGIIMTMSWLGSDVRVFRWEALDRALAHLEPIPGVRRADIEGAIARLRDHLLAQGGSQRSRSGTPP